MHRRKNPSEQTRFGTSCRTLSPSGGGIGTLANVLLNLEPVSAATPVKVGTKGKQGPRSASEFVLVRLVREWSLEPLIGVPPAPYRVGFADRSRVIWLRGEPIPRSVTGLGRDKGRESLPTHERRTKKEVRTSKRPFTVGRTAVSGERRTQETKGRLPPLVRLFLASPVQNGRHA